MAAAQRELTELRARPEALHLFRGHTLLVSAQDGVVHGRSQEGIYERNTRIAATWKLLINGVEPAFVSASAVDAYSMLAYYLAPDILQEVRGLQPEEKALVLQVERFVGGGMHEDVTLRNFTQKPVDCELAWEVSADFADFAETADGRRRQTAEVSTDWRCVDDARELYLRYLHPSLDRATIARFPLASGGPDYENGRVRYRIHVEPRAERHFCVAVIPVFEGIAGKTEQRCHAFGMIPPDCDRAREHSLGEATRVETTNPIVQTAWKHAIADLTDLAMLDGDWPACITPAAGIPGYQSLFGRDVLTASWQTALAHTALMEATIASTARLIGTKPDDFHDEEPGRIVQQVNPGPLAELGITPFRRYYGDYAAPPQFLTVVGQSYMWTGDADGLRRHYDEAERVLEWIDRRADRDGDGFVEYDTRSPLGQKNQGWKDSGMSMVYEDGRGVPNPIASCELQAYVYVAKQQYAAAIALGLKKYREAARLLREAAELKKRFNESFWMPEEKFVALALDRDKHQVRSIASNAGHCLAAGIVAGEWARTVAERLMQPDMFSGWGIRTLSSKHPAYNPFSYQLGSVWPVENATIAFGFKRYGFHDLCNEVARGFFDTAALFPHCRLPEVFGGDAREPSRPHPGVYPQAELPQAWSASAVPLMVQAMLGLRPLAPLHILLIYPVLPDWLPDVTLRDLRVGSARVSIRFHRERDGSTHWKVIEKHGSLRVLQQAPESEGDVGMLTRGRDAVRSFVPGLH